MARLQKMALDWARPFSLNKAEGILSLKEPEKLAALGYQLRLLQREADLRGAPLDDFYYTYEETTEFLQQIAAAYLYLVRRYKVGQSTRFGYSIWELKITDHPEIDEDESTILIDGLHHAREP